MATNIAMYPNARLTPNNEIERKNRKQAFPLTSRLLPIGHNGHKNDRDSVHNTLNSISFFLVLSRQNLSLRMYTDSNLFL